MIRIGTTNVSPKVVPPNVQNNVSPKVVPPNVQNIKVCACQDSPMGNGETKKFHCGATGRYLVVLLGKKEYLSLCEVEVFEGNILHTGK